MATDFPLRRIWYADAVLLLGRVALGLLFLLAGVHKIQGGIEGWMTFYRTQVPSFVPGWFAMPYGQALPYLEVAVGALLLVGLWTRIVGAVMALMLLSFTITLMYHKGLSGGSPGPFHPNLVFIALALVFVAFGAGAVSLDSLWRRRRSGTPRPAMA